MRIEKHGKITISNAGGKVDGFSVDIIGPGDDRRGFGSDHADLRGARQMFMLVPWVNGGNISASELTFELSSPVHVEVSIRGRDLPDVTLTDLSGETPLVERIIPTEPDGCEVCGYWAVRIINGQKVCFKCRDTELLKSRPTALDGHALTIQEQPWMLGTCPCGWGKNNLSERDRLEKAFEWHLNSVWLREMSEVVKP